MCVTVLLVLKNKVQITPRQEQQWFNSYIGTKEDEEENRKERKGNWL